MLHRYNKKETAIPIKGFTIPKNQQKQLEQEEKKYAQQIRKLQLKNKQAEAKLQVVLAQLTTVSNTNQSHIHKMATTLQITETENLKQSKQALVEQLNRVELSNLAKDSLCNEAITIQSNQLSNKDTAILLLEKQYVQTKERLSMALNQNQYTATVLKKEKRKSARLKIAAVILSSILIFKTK
jgi:transcriptional regulator of NAD metabolism